MVPLHVDLMVEKLGTHSASHTPRCGGTAVCVTDVWARGKGRGRIKKHQNGTLEPKGAFLKRKEGMLVFQRQKILDSQKYRPVFIREK